MAGGLFSNGAGPSVIDCTAILDSSIIDRTAELLQMGVLVAFGTTRDRGALSITVTHDGAFDREYFRDSPEAANYLGRAVDALHAMGLGTAETDPTPVSLARRRRQKLT